MSDFDVNKMALPGGNTNAPAQKYGAGVEAERLKQSLPATPHAPEGKPGNPALPTLQPLVTPAQQREGRPATGAAVPPGIPGVLATPTGRPDVPINTPLMAPPVNPVGAAANPMQARLAVLDGLVQSPTTSAETKEWARALLNTLIR